MSLGVHNFAGMRRTYVVVSLLAVAGCQPGLQTSLGIRINVSSDGNEDDTKDQVDKGNALQDDIRIDPAALTNAVKSLVHLPGVNACETNAPAPRAYRRLTQNQINQTVSDLFGNAPDVPQTTTLFNSDPAVYGFNAMNATLVVEGNMSGVMMYFAESIGDYAGQNVGRIFTSCSRNDDACRTTFVTTVGKRVFRMPLTTMQTQAYVALMAAQSSFNDGVQVALSAMLQSPYFLYRSELGTATDQGAYRLSQYEIAQELSYFLTDSMPDAQLMAAADSNALSTADQIKAQATRLLQTMRARAAAQEFFAEWLQLNLLPAAFRQENMTFIADNIKAAMYQEGVRLTAEAMFDTDGSAADLYQIDHTWLNQDLANYYGISGANGTTYTSIPLANTGRGNGILGLGGVVAAASSTMMPSPVLRGRFVRMRLLCGVLPKPPANVPAVDETDTNTTVRQRFEAHLSNPACTGCHKLMDPLGHPMGLYDTIGRLRPGGMENGALVDTSGYVLDVATGNKTNLNNLADLSSFLAGSSDAAACFSRHLSMYALGSVTFAQDGCTFGDVATYAAQSSYNLKDTFIAVTQAKSFIERSIDR